MKRTTLALAAGAALIVIAGGCGGSSTTTIIEKTVATDSTAGMEQKTPALLGSVAVEHWSVEPAVYSFSVDGDVAGIGLAWEGWGSPTATGTGTIEERDFSGGPNDRRKYPGTVVATSLEECKGQDYYTEVSANLPKNALFVPESSYQLSTPCRSPESISQEEAPTESKVEGTTVLKHCGELTGSGFNGDYVVSGISCEEGIEVFDHVHCTDSSCEKRRSGSWVCIAQTETKLRGGGVCQLGEKFIRWHVFE